MTRGGAEEEEGKESQQISADSVLSADPCPPPAVVLNITTPSLDLRRKPRAKCLTWNTQVPLNHSF